MCDCTRLQMAAKQMGQTLTHLNCEIPYTISNEFRNITNYSESGILIAQDDGNVLFREKDILVVLYKNNTLKNYYVPIIKQTASNFASTLRYIISDKQNFKKGDILFEYDCFNGGVPTFGYNTFTAYMPFFGYNHEDSIVISESLSNKMKHKYIEKLIIPISEYTIFQPIYSDVENSLLYFPNIGQRIKEDIFCTTIQPKSGKNSYNNKDLKYRMLMLLKSMNISDLISMKRGDLSLFSVDNIKSKIHNGIVTGYKLHKIQNKKLVSADVESVLNIMYHEYFNDYAIKTFKEFNNRFTPDYSKVLAKKFLVYSDKDTEVMTNRKDIRNSIYILEV